MTLSLTRELGASGGRLVAQVGTMMSGPRGAVLGDEGRERRRSEFVCALWRSAP